MTVTINGTTGIANDGGYTGDGVVFADTTPANTLVTTTGGNVGIGTSSPGYRLDVAAGDTTAGFGYAVRLRSNATAGAATLQFTDAPVSVQTGYIAVTDAGVMDFSNKVRIDSSGKLLYNCTGQTGDAPNTAGGRINETNGNEKVRVVTNGQVGFQFYSPSGGTGSPVGSVTVNASSTSYVTSSDYRLKENIAPMTGALSRVAALNPVTYTWKNTGEADEGFIAHELQEVCPSAVTGEKDAVDADGNPQYQGIDTSFLVATLTAAIQEQQAIINAQQAALTALTARVTALEGA